MKIEDALKEWLQDNKDNYTEWGTTVGGCDTCGYGGSSSLELDMDALFDEIDKFYETFNKEVEHPEIKNE